MDDAQIKYMVDRFLGWPLPKDFSPDNGITIKRPNYGASVEWTPCGTNLLTAPQADAMIRHMLEGMTSAGANTESSPMPPEAPTQGMIQRAVAVYRRIASAADTSPESLMFDIWQAMYDEWQSVSPTQTVKPEQPRDFTRWRGAFRPMPEDETWDLDRSAAAPGPTAGDVERVAQAMLSDLGNALKLNMADPHRRVVPGQLSSADLMGMAEVAIASARAELLAQIRELLQDAQTHYAMARKSPGYIGVSEGANSLVIKVRALAYKLTEAK